MTDIRSKLSKFYAANQLTVVLKLDAEHQVRLLEEMYKLEDGREK